LWLHSLKVVQLLRSAACLHTNQSRSYLNHLVYHKMQHNFQFDLQIFTSVQCGFLVSRGRCLIYKRFRPKSYDSRPRQWSQPLLLSVPVVLPNLQEEVERKLCL